MTLPIPATLDFVQIAIGVGAFLLSLRVPMLAPWLAPFLPKLPLPGPPPAKPADPAAPAHPASPADLLAGVRDVLREELRRLLHPAADAPQAMAQATATAPAQVMLPNVPGTWQANDDGSYNWTPPCGAVPARVFGLAAGVPVKQ